MKSQYKNKKFLLFFSIFVLISSLLCGCGLFPKEEEGLRPPLVKPKAEEYNLYKVAKNEITKSVKGTGTLISVNDSSQFFKKSGLRLNSLNVKNGDKVKKGDLLASADDGSLKSQITLQELEIKKKQLDLQYLKDKYTKSKEASTTDPNVDLKEMEKDISIKEIDMQAANINLNELKRQLSDMTLVALVDGVVTFVDSIKTGDVIEAYKTVVTVSDPQNLQIFYQSDTVKDVKNGMTAKLSYLNKEYTGNVVLCPDSVPAEKAEKFKNAVLIQANDLTATGKMGDSVDIDITLLTKKEAIVVPKTAVKRFLDATTVQIMDGATKKEVSVELGIESATEVEILSGLKEGDNVILQ